jgi:hypothetical protein
MDVPAALVKIPNRSWLFFTVAPSILCALVSASAITLSHDDAVRIGHRIWKNECNGTIAGLTSWNEGENFASLGIGHFIWYPANARGPFEESFPALARFISERGAKLPAVARSPSCPWNSRAEFSAAQSSPEMKTLRDFLATTVDLQAEFMVARLQNALPKMLEETAPENRARVRQQFERLAKTPAGCYALIDYVNFKGEGVLATERYRGEGWGLLQVLEGMESRDDAPAKFARSAASVLTRRVRNSPPARHEARWLPGWLNRVGTYEKS